MSFLDKFLDVIKLNDDYDDDDEFLDDEEEDDQDDDLMDEDNGEDETRSKPRKRFFSRFSSDEEDEDDQEEESAGRTSRKYRSSASRSATDEAPARRAASARKSQKSPARESRSSSRRDTAGDSRLRSSKVTPIGASRRKSSMTGMEVNVIRPSSMEDTREIADTLMQDCTVVLNLEGLDVDIAQRVIDFTCGVCYSLNGNLQKISSYIFILTPANVDISGDFQSILNGAFDIPSMKDQY